MHGAGSLATVATRRVLAAIHDPGSVRFACATEPAPQQALDRTAFVRRAEGIAERQAEHGATTAWFEIGPGCRLMGVGFPRAHAS